ncbi:hypothetical protein [Gorillibacterium massiliense]|uniref:hypothetical protein n=1 Tax=Gorillibacterium massiliense TaxID=1280390 RepID=UPI0004AE825F|nr:hypothetical protein [Gorillibacterium massiliense]
MIKKGYVSSVDPLKRTARITFTELERSVTAELPIASHLELSVSDYVVVAFTSSSNMADGMIISAFTESAMRINQSLGFYPESGNLPQAPYNFAVITGMRGGVEYTELWILVNAWYDYKTKRFKRVDLDNFSFGWQLQGGGTYPGEESTGDFINQGVNLWKANGKKAYGEDDPSRELTGEDIGALQSDGSWREFGIMLGWNNHFMCDAYGGMTIGGSGFEIDGSGTSPFKRISLGKFSGGSTDSAKAYPDYGYAYNGTLWNGQHGLWNMDERGYNSFFWGMVSPLDFYDTGYYNPYTGRAKLEGTKMVWRKLPKNTDPRVENWFDIAAISEDGSMTLMGKPVPAVLEVKADIVNMTDFNMAYPDDTWNKHNIVILAVKGVLESGNLKQVGGYNATFTDYGAYGYLGSGEFISAKILISKI